MKLWTSLKTSLLALMLAGPIVKADSVTVTITVDNDYGFGFGNINGIYGGQYYGGVANCYASNIFGESGSGCYNFVSPDLTVPDTGPEIYTNISAHYGDYIYIVAWSDDFALQGAAASFVYSGTFGNITVTTSPAWPWQVFATGIHENDGCGTLPPFGPPLTGTFDSINSQIALANAGDGAPGTSSVGWVGVTGADNSLANGCLYFNGSQLHYNPNDYNEYSEFFYGPPVTPNPIAVPACIGAGTQWMEYDPKPTNANCNPFDWDSVTNANPTLNALREYLIYRFGPIGAITSSNVCSNGCITLTTPGNFLVTNCANSQLFYTPTATDTCCSNVTVVCTPASGSYFAPGTTTTVTCEATDTCGNSNFCNFTVSVQCPSTNCCSNCAPPYPDDYTVTVYPGYNYLADDLCQGTNNTVADLLPTVPDGTQLLIWDQTSQSYDAPLIYHRVSGWDDTTTTLSPGEGFLLENLSGTNFTITIDGCQPNCPPPCMPSNGFSLVGGFGTNAATWTNLFSCPPPCGTEVSIWNPVSQQFTTDIYANGVWTPSAPLLGVGQAAWVYVSTNLGLSVICPTNKTVPCDSNWTFDPPTALSCCSSNVDITSLGFVTNGTCPMVITETWMLADGCSNTAICDQTVTVVPIQPILICASNKTVSGGLAWSFDPPAASNACCPNLTICVLSIVTNVTCNPCAINYTCTWQVTDCCTNAATCTQTVTVIPPSPCQIFNTGMNGAAALAVDGVDPNFDLFGYPNGAVVINPSDLPVGDLSDGPNSQWIGPDDIYHDENPGVYHYQVQFVLCCTQGAELSGQMAAVQTAGVYLNGAQVGSISASSGATSWTPISVTDGNLFVACPLLNVLDIYVTNEAGPFGPVFSSPTAFRAELTNCFSPFLVYCPSNKTVPCDSNWTFDPPTATSCCSSNVTITPIGLMTNGTCPTVITETWLLTDGCSNMAVCDQMVTVVPVQPILICASNKTVSGGLAWSFDPPAASNACCTNLTICVLNIATNATCSPCAINYTCTWQVTDCCTNTATCTQTVTVIPPSPCQVFNTGMNGAAALAGGAPDPNFELFGYTDGAVVINPADVPGGDLPDGPNSQWIGPDEYSYYEPSGVYHYQLQFVVCSSNSAELSGRIAAAKTAGVYLNGTQVGSISASSGATSWTPINVTNVNLFVACPLLNVLDIYVTNYFSLEDPTASSPTAFRAELTNCVTPFTNRLVFGGLTQTALGDASLAVSGNQLVVSNMGSSGQDGVSIVLPTNRMALEVEWQPLDPSNTLPVGAYIQELVIGTAHGITNVELGTVTMTKLCGYCDGSNFLISADFSPIGASNFTVQAYLQGVLVAQATNQPGPALAYCDMWGDSGCIPMPTVPRGGWDWETNLTGEFLPLVTIDGLASVQCDHLYIIPENVSGIPTIFQIMASQVPVLNITAVTVSPLLVSLSQTGQNVTLQWFGTGVVQVSSDLAHWSVVSGAISPYTVPLGQTNQYFRVSQPSP
jgi:hypothetical protein